MTDFTKRALRRLSPIYGESHFAESFFDALSFDYEKLRGF